MSLVIVLDLFNIICNYRIMYTELAANRFQFGTIKSKPKDQVPFLLCFVLGSYPVWLWNINWILILIHIKEVRLAGNAISRCVKDIHLLDAISSRWCMLHTCVNFYRQSGESPSRGRTESGAVRKPLSSLGSFFLTSVLRCPWVTFEHFLILVISARLCR